MTAPARGDDMAWGRNYAALRRFSGPAWVELAQQRRRQLAQIPLPRLAPRPGGHR